MGTFNTPLNLALRPQNFKRGKGRYKADYHEHALYEFYKKRVIKPVDYQTFHKVTKDFHEQVVNRLLLGGNGFKLPFANGEIRVCKFLKSRGKSLPIDFKRSYELGFRVAHLNEERNGAIYKWKWIKPRFVRGRKPLLYHYSFIPCRGIKRKLKDVLRENPQLDYYEFIKMSTY